MRFLRRRMSGSEPDATLAAQGPGPATPAPEGDPQRPPDAAAPATGSEAVVVPPTLEERVDGLRAWLGQLDRKLGVRTYALGAAVVLALAAGIVGVVLAVSAKDESATKGELRALRDEVQGVGEEAAAAAADDVASLSSRLDDLETQVNGLAGDQRTTGGELSVVQDDIEDLRNTISDLRANPPAADAGAGDSGAP